VIHHNRWYRFLPKNDDVPMGAALFRTILTNGDVTAWKAPKS